MVDVQKSSSDFGSWVMRDVMRGWKVNGFERLFAESDQMEDPSWSDSNYFPINSTGFGSSTDWFGSNTECICMAIRRPQTRRLMRQMCLLLTTIKQAT